MRLTELRKKADVSQQTVADYLGVTRQAYSLYERGSRKIDYETLLKLSEFFGCSVEELYRKDVRNAKPVSIPFSDGECEIIKKYRALDEHGTKLVNSVLNIEYERCRSVQNFAEEAMEPQSRVIQLSLLPASAGTGSFLDDNSSEEITIPVTDEYRQVDFAARVSGNSMEPDYHDGDIVLVREQPAVEIGEVGLFTLDNIGYIKEQGADRLISLNSDYDDIYPSEHENIKCWGKVVGVLK